MRNKRFSWMIIFASFMVAVALISIGFASFSKTIDISTASGNTTDRTNVFESSIHYDTTYTPTVTSSNYVVVDDVGVVNGKAWSGISFTVNPTSSVSAATFTIRARVINESEYTAYLKSINTDGEIIDCQAIGSVDADSVTTACRNIIATFNITGTSGSSGAVVSGVAAMNYTPSSTVTLGPNSTSYVDLSVIVNRANLSPGDFKINIPTIYFTYSSIE